MGRQKVPEGTVSNLDKWLPDCTLVEMPFEDFGDETDRSVATAAVAVFAVELPVKNESKSGDHRMDFH